MEVINIHGEWLANRVEHIGVDRVKSITPFMQDGEVWYHVCYTEPKQTANAELFK